MCSVQIKKRMKIEILVNHSHIPIIKTKDVNKANEKESVFDVYSNAYKAWPTRSDKWGGGGGGVPDILIRR